ncbi:hypothetical protein ACNOYE_13625 [Nannocystaceae bacterium ST9]
MPRALATYALPLDERELFAALAQPFRGGEFGELPSTPDELGEALDLAAAGLPTLHCDFQAARLLLQCGTLIEYGAPASRIAVPIAERTRAIFGRARALLDRDPEPDLHARMAEHADEVRAYLGAHFAGLAAMASLCRDQPGRMFARTLAGFDDDAGQIAGKVPSAYYVERLLATVDEFVFEVLDLESRRGFRLRAWGVASSYHLFTLIQGALIGDPEQGWLAGDPPDPELLAFATNHARGCASEGDSNAWHYLEWPAWTGPDASPSVAWTLWGQTKPQDIARFQGVPTILLARKSMHVGWGVEFVAPLHDAHAIGVEVEARLDAREVEARLLAIAAAPR